MHVLARLLGIAVILSTLSGPAMACGPTSDCELDERHYRIRMPAGHDGTSPVGLLVFAHGYRGNERGAMKSKGFAALGKRWNMAIVGVKSARADWSIPGAPSSNPATDIDELAYFDSVLADVARRHPVDMKRIVAVGSSAGGMMVWNLICHRGDRFAGFIPYSGTFWEPTPKTCTSPAANIVHIHGTKDKVVPLTGRRIANTKQGNVHTVMAMYTDYGGYAAKGKKRVSDMTCDRRSNPDGQMLNFCLFPGGHVFRLKHVQHALEMLKDAGRLE